MDKSTGYSLKGYRFVSQHMPDGSQPAISPLPGVLIPLLVSMDRYT